MASIVVRMLGDSSQLERSFKRANASASGFNRNMSKTGKASAVGQKGMRGLGSSVRLAGGAFLGGAGLIAGITSTLSKTAQFEKSLNTFQAVSGATADQMKAVGKTAQTLGADFTLPATSAGDAALAMTELAKGGLNVRQAMAAAKGTLQLAAAGGVEVADAATISARALNAFSLGGDQAGRVADVLANAANVSTGEISDFAAALQQSSSSAKQYGLTIEDTATALGIMANKGIVGSDAGTSLKTMLARLVPSTEKAKKEMLRLGVSYQDAEGNLIPFRDQIGQYQKALSRLTPAQRATAINTIFGSDAQRAANIILGGGVEAYDKMHVSISRQGAAAKIAAAKQKGLAGALDGLKSVVESLQILVGTQLAPALTKYLNQASRWLGDSKNQEKIMGTLKTAMASVAAVLRTIRTIFQTLSTVLGGNKNAVIFLVGAFVAFKALNMASSVAAIARNFGLLTAKTNAQTAATARATAAGKTFKLSMVGKAGLVGAVGLAAFGITSMILKLTGLDKKLKGVGASAFDAAAKLGLVNDPGAKFEGKRVIGPAEAKRLRQTAGRLQAQGLSPNASAAQLIRQHPNLAPADIRVLAGATTGRGVPPVQVTVQLDSQVVGKVVTEAQRKAAKRNTTQRRGRISGR